MKITKHKLTQGNKILVFGMKTKNKNQLTWQVTQSVWQSWVLPDRNSPYISVMDPVSIPPVRQGTHKIWVHAKPLQLRYNTFELIFSKIM